MNHPYRLPYKQWRRLSSRARSAQKRNVSEVCGLFAVNGRREIQLFFVQNESPGPGKFEFGWNQFYQVREAIRAAGFRYLGIFHSHPVAEAIPGPGDIRGARENEWMLIQDVCGSQAKLWRIVRRGRKKSAVEKRLNIERSSRPDLSPPRNPITLRRP